MPVSLAFGGGDSESDRRIRELLDEGQTAFDAGDPQGAIDAWSRIFLIDIDHQEASRRIEAARKLKAENERQVEEIFHDGLAQLEAGDAAGARRAFQRVLEIQPGYFAAREYLQQLDAGTVPAREGHGAGDRRAGRPPPLQPRGGGARPARKRSSVPPEPFESRGPRRAPAGQEDDGRRGARQRTRPPALPPGGGSRAAARPGGRLVLPPEPRTALPQLAGGGSHAPGGGREAGDGPHQPRRAAAQGGPHHHRA